MAKSAFIGMAFKRGEQHYECVAIRPYQRGDGKMTKLAVWRANCPECGEAFEVICSISMIRGPLNRRCLLHRAPGKRVERGATDRQRSKRVFVVHPAGVSRVSVTAASQVHDDHETALTQGCAA
jgi:hypothetical protein